MKINYLKINNFGKINNKEINFENNINLIKGKNESGKTSLLKFIVGMFYGISKNKNGKEFSDFDRYNPWNKEEFSGKIKYELDNKECYEVFRDFNKKSPKIYNNKLEDISKEFTIDKSKQNQFFYDQTKIDELLFLNTTIVEQDNSVLDLNSQNVLTQKIANILSTGEDNISYKKIADKLNKKLIEEVGTDRTQGRPINNISEQINLLENRINLLEENKLKKEEIKNKIIEKQEEINLLENELNLLKEIKIEKENEKIEIEKIKIKNNLNQEYENKINSLKAKNKNNFIESKKNSKKINKINLIIFPILIIINIIANIIKINKTINYMIIFLTAIYLLINLIIFIINKKRIKLISNKNNIENVKIKNEINLLEENIKNTEKEINYANNIIKENRNKKLINIQNKYINCINKEEIINSFNKELQEINSEIVFLDNKFNNNKININTLYIEEKNINEKLEEYSETEERLQYLYEEKNNINKLEKIIELVRDSLEDAYNDIKNNVTPKFTRKLSELMENISGGKYKNIKFNTDEGLIVELENGEYINANRLSLGTIDQLYLSLRLSSMLEITNEKMPIILDETFAYYDNNRLENIIKYLNENYKENQIIIFSCNNREKEIMDKLNIKYNLIEL